MSSDDSGFDKEAEREKLREKYEKDQQDRENTRRMSELLLQGATMTGKHCGECGDPIFRYDGQEFCPTCQQEVEGGAAETNGTEASGTDAETEATDDAGADAADGVEDDSTTGDAGERPRPEGTADRSDAGRTTDSAGEGTDSAGESATSDDEPRVEIEGVRVADRHADRSNLRRPPSAQSGDRPARNRRDASRPVTADRRSPRRAREHTGDARDRDARERDASGRGGDARERAASASGRARGAGDLGPARESLVRTLTDLARRAEETDDAGHARELLAAAREAAEALAALDRANL